MSITCNTVHTKNGAIFATAQDAWADKNSLYTPELRQSVHDCFVQMISDGIMLEAAYPVWNQDTFELTIVKVVSSAEAYNAAITFDTAELKSLADNAGWVFVRNFTN